MSVITVGAMPTQKQLDGLQKKISKSERTLEMANKRLQSSKRKVEDCAGVQKAHENNKGDVRDSKYVLEHEQQQLERMQKTKDYFPDLNTRQLALAMASLEKTMMESPNAHQYIDQVKQYLWTVIARGLLDAKVAMTTYDGTPYMYDKFIDGAIIGTLEEYQYHDAPGDHFSDPMNDFHRVYQLLLDLPREGGGAGGSGSSA